MKKQLEEEHRLLEQKKREAEREILRKYAIFDHRGLY